MLFLSSFHLPLPFWLALACSSGLGSALAERADRNQPMTAEADVLRYDDTRQTSLFTGRVVISKGSMLIRGEQVEIRQDSNGNQFGTVWAANGQPAFFRQKRNQDHEFIEGQAQRIDYDGKADVVTFNGQAVLRRYRGTVLSDETSGNTIVYDNNTDVFRVDGGGGMPSSNNPSGRVRAIVTPKSAFDAPATMGKPLPLQPSTTLESKP